jgi:hypothetical protein
MGNLSDMETRAPEPQQLHPAAAVGKPINELYERTYL